MRPLLNAPDTRLTTLQQEQEEERSSRLAIQNFAQDPHSDGEVKVQRPEARGRKHVCYVLLVSSVICQPFASLYT